MWLYRVISINFHLVSLQCVINYEYIVESQCHRDFKFIDVHRVYIVKYLKVACGLTCIDLIDCCIIIYFKLQKVGLLRTSPDCENTQCNYWSFSIQADCKWNILKELNKIKVCTIPFIKNHFKIIITIPRRSF